MNRAFDFLAAGYDQWYEAPEGSAVFREEVECLSQLRKPGPGAWLEVGVGTGRFAGALGITVGIDTSPRMLEFAAMRGVNAIAAEAENLPFPAESFEGVLMALSFCFIGNPRLALKECRRVLRPGGRLLLGIIPANSPWGQEYTAKASRGHPIYSLAHFHTAGETVELARDAGFGLVGAASGLLWKPGAQRRGSIETGIVQEAGFIGLLFSPA